MTLDDSPGYVDPDEADGTAPAPQPAATVDGVRAAAEDAPEREGFTAGGLTATEAATIGCITLGSFALATIILVMMDAHGLHHTPPLLWGVFILLVTTPLLLAFGTTAGTALLAGIGAVGSATTDPDTTTTAADAEEAGSESTAESAGDGAR